MESMESIRAQQPAINHATIRHAKQAFMYARQQDHNKRLRASIYTPSKDGANGAMTSAQDGESVLVHIKTTRLKMPRIKFKELIK